MNPASRAAPASADPLTRIVGLSVQRVPLSEAMGRLAAEGVPLVYSTRLVEAEGLVSCACAGQTLGRALDELLRGTRLGYRTTPAGEVVIVARDLARAQDDAWILSGNVLTPTLQPVRGAVVAIPALDQVAISDEQGRYRLRIPVTLGAAEQIVEVSSIGYRPRSVAVAHEGSRELRRDLTLVEEAVQLDEVIVAGTAGRQERRAQAAVVATVDAERIVPLAPVTTASHLLQARVPGVNVTSGSGSVGAAQRIRIRGISSLMLSSAPLVFVDGVAVSGQHAQLFNLGAQGVSRLDDLSPDQIEVIEVVKGPAAATLYGADAAAGVISIRTKRGRPGSGFSHSSSLEAGATTPVFRAPLNWAECTQGLILQNVHACHGQPVGALITDDPLNRYRVFRPGFTRSFAHSIRGGGEEFGAYLSVGHDREDGSIDSNSFSRTSIRTNFDFTPTDRLSVGVGFGISRTSTRLPYSDNMGYGLISAAVIGSPLTLGTAADGWFSGAGLARLEGRLALENWDDTYRVQPRVELTWTPAALEHRLVVGGDMARTRGWSFTPRNDELWYQSSEENTGIIRQARLAQDRLTVDYLGNVRRHLTPALRADLSWGSQMLISQGDLVSATGIGLVSNQLRSVSSARTQSGTQSRSESRALGVLGQAQLSVRDRLFTQVAGRVDRSASYGADAQPFFSPRVGASYVISEEPFWERLRLPVPTLRLRAAYGASGRSPQSGARGTLALAPYLVLDTDSVATGVLPDRAGNARLRPERTTELEMGFDAALLDDRASVEVTLFRKLTSDALMFRTVAPSVGAGSELINIARITNRGVEVAARARVVALPSFGWESGVALTTLANRVVSLGDVEEFGSLNRTRAGAPAGALYTRRVESVDLESGHAIVSGTAQMMGNVLPGHEIVFGNTLNAGRLLTLYLQLDHRGDFVRYNQTDEYRDRWANNSERWVRRDEILSPEERIRRFGPYRTRAGTAVTSPQVLESYIEDATYTRLREASLSVRLPDSVIDRVFRGSEARLTLTGRNLLTWTAYSGLDPETLYTDTTELFTIPVERRWSLRLSVRQ